MKSTISLVVVTTFAISTGLLMALPRYRASASKTARNAPSKAERDSVERQMQQRANSEYSSPGDDPMQQQIVSNEREELDSLKTGNLELFGSLLADEAVFVDANGPASKAEVWKNVGEFRLLEYAMEDVRFVPISAESGLITYRVTEKGMSHGREFAAQVYVSAVWTKHGGKWICLFSQETAAK